MALVSYVLFHATVAVAVDCIALDRDGKTCSLSGRVLTRAQNGGLLLEVPDGTFWAIQPQEITRESADDRPFQYLSREQFVEQLLSVLPDGFQAHTTARYVICYDTSKAYAAWCGGLFERLNQAFMNYWTRRGIRLYQPEYPLPVIIFSSKTAYREFAKDELGEAAGSILGYYSLRTNRVTMYDLTGVESIRSQRSRRSTVADINQLLARPEAEPLVATIVHEATHQLAYNSGMQTRYADNPMWLSEGLAIYFETPDLSSYRGWRGIGQINRNRLNAFRESLTSRTPDAMARLVADDNRFKNPENTLAAYAESWSLSYFFINKRPKEFQAYLQLVAKKPRLIWDEPARRLEDFKQCFGDDLVALDQEFLRYMASIK